MTNVTRLLEEIDQGDTAAPAKLLPLVYDELKRLAAKNMKNEAPGHTLQATALVHEAYLRLLGSGRETTWEGKRHFFGAAAEAMRRILIENARRKKAIKHGGGRGRVGLDDVEAVSASDDELIAMGDALAELEKIDRDSAEVVKLRFFAGLNYEQIGKILDISERTANRRWDYAKAWLRRKMKEDGGPPTG